MSKCSNFGHTYDVIAHDENYTMERCIECGHKERFCRHDNREKYAKEHSIDTIQAWDKQFAEIYPETVKRLKESKRKSDQEGQEAQQKMEEAKYEIKRMSMTSKFVH